jgi:hypothetical protein
MNADGNGDGDGDGVESGGHLDEHGHDSVEQGLSSAIGRLIDELQHGFRAYRGPRWLKKIVAGNVDSETERAR